MGRPSASRGQLGVAEAFHVGRGAPVRQALIEAPYSVARVPGWVALLARKAAIESRFVMLVRRVRYPMGLQGRILDPFEGVNQLYWIRSRRQLLLLPIPVRAPLTMSSSIHD